MIEENTIRVDAYFGGCPECGNNDGYVNVERDHWCVCDAHKLRWNIGSNLFSDWKSESESDWRKYQETLLEYKIAEDVLPEGEWPLDPLARALRLREAALRWQEAKEARERQLRLRGLAEKLVTDALKALSAQMKAGDEVRVTIGAGPALLVNHAGVQRDRGDDFPF